MAFLAGFLCGLIVGAISGCILMFYFVAWAAGRVVEERRDNSGTPM